MEERQNPEPMGPKVRELLLAEAREKHKAELDRYNQAFTRSGIYLAILAVYVNVLSRFWDKLPLDREGPLYVAFVIACGLLVLLVLMAFVFILLALRRVDFEYGVLPSGWKSYYENALLPWGKMLDVKDAGELDTEMEGHLKEMIILRLSEAVDHNFRGVNNTRSTWLARASRVLLYASVVLIANIVLFIAMNIK